MVPNWFLDHLQPFLVKSFLDQVPNKGFPLVLQVSLQPNCKNLDSGVPSLMAADKPCPQLQPSLIYYLCLSMHSMYLPALWDANFRTLALELFVWALIWRHTRTTQFIRTVVTIVNSVTLVRFVNTLLQIGTFELGPRTGNGWAIFFIAVVKTIVVSVAFPALGDTVSWVMTSELEIKINKKLNLWSENVNILRQQNDKGLKVAFFRKCDSFFKSPNFLKKNIPKNYPELEI